MQVLGEYALAAFWTILPIAATFALLALVVKRRAIFAAVRRCKDEFSTNLGLAIINSILLAPLLAVPSDAVSEVLLRNHALTEFWSGFNEPLTLLIAILAIELFAYWRHRFEHHPAVWRIHATHHADEAIHWLTVQRKHPLAKALSVLFDNLLLFMLGMPLWALVAAGLIRSWWGYFIHADVPWTLGTFGKVLMSPAAHRLHHIRDEQLMGTNYGNMLTIWDRLFGTYVDPAPYLNCETGIAEGTRGLVGELWRPFEKRYRKTGKVEAGVSQPT